MTAMHFYKPRSNCSMGLFVGLFLGVCLMLVGAANLVSPAKAASQINAADSVIKAITQELESYLLSNPSNIEQRKNLITNIVDNYFDLPSIARFSAGPYWRTATEDERRIFSETLRVVMIGAVLRNFDQLTGFKFEIIDSQAKGDRMVLVRGNFNDIKAARPPISASWRIVTPVDGAARVLDVELENISMLVTQKQENIAIIRKNGGRFGALIEAMQLQIGN